MPEQDAVLSPSDNRQVLLFQIVFLAIIVSIVYAVRDTYQRKHTGYPPPRVSDLSKPPTRYERYEAVQSFIKTSGRPNLDRDMHLSEPPIWASNCQPAQSEVRVVSAVIDPTNGDTNDVTMYFCVNQDRSVQPAEPKARYFTGQ
jgi:hypothetical protein